MLTVRPSLRQLGQRGFSQSRLSTPQTKVKSVILMHLRVSDSRDSSCETIPSPSQRSSLTLNCDDDSALGNEKKKQGHICSFTYLKTTQIARGQSNPAGKRAEAAAGSAIPRCIYLSVSHSS